MTTVKNITIIVLSGLILVIYYLRNVLQILVVSETLSLPWSIYVQIFKKTKMETKKIHSVTKNFEKSKLKLAIRKSKNSFCTCNSHTKKIFCNHQEP